MLVAGVLGQPLNIVESIDEAQVRKFKVLASDGCVGGLNVQIRDVIREDRHLISVQFLQVLVLELGKLTTEMLQQFGDKSTGAHCRVKDLHITINEIPAEVFVAEPVGALDHEAHDLVGGIDHAQPIGCLLVVDLIEVLINDFEEGLLLVVATDLGSCSANGGIVRVEATQCAFLEVARKECSLQSVELLRDIVVMVEVILAEDL